MFDTRGGARLPKDVLLGNGAKIAHSLELNHYEPERMGNIQTPIKRQGSFVGSEIGWLAETLNSAHSLSSGDVGSRGLDLGDEHGAVTARGCDSNHN